MTTAEKDAVTFITGFELSLFLPVAHELGTLGIGGGGGGMDAYPHIFLKLIRSVPNNYFHWFLTLCFYECYSNYFTQVLVRDHSCCFEELF